MKKMVLAILSVIMVTLLGVMTVGCGKEELNMGKECVKFKTQLDALTQLKEGTVNVAVIDSVMAGYYTSKGDYRNDLMVVSNLVLAEEKYGIAAKKGNNSLMHMVNQALIALSESGEYQNVASIFGLENSTLAIASDPYEGATDSSWSTVQSRKKIVIGYTVFAPISFTDNGNFTGFDTELARAVVNVWNEGGSDIEIEFQEINWDSKESLLENGTIDLVWNGMTITTARSEEMCISVPYLANKQVAVIRKTDASKYITVESMAKAVIGVEKGSAGQDVVIKK
ncbi:MAG: transporter substrate-binding domain-containing protein [Clostridia bacterium]|nr:transporter substrate-binding domain-containing protein [Clostridia bacterium]